MKRIFTAIWILLLSSPAMAQMKWNSTYQSYIDQYKDLAIEEMLRYHIPASITLAQGLFESGAGRSELAVKGNNHFGIKCHGWTGATTYHDDDARHECFRAYDTVFESFEDHSKFLMTSQRYRSLFQLSQTDYKGWARGLKACGYATNPLYADKLIEIIQLYHLHDYDRAKSYDKLMAHTSAGHPDQQRGTLHPIYRYNGNYYLKARSGDTFQSIGKEVGISYRKLAKYNERNKRFLLQNGDIVYLKKKRTKAEKSYKNQPHIVKEGDSMYSIAQTYGIRLKSLYRKNHLSSDHQLRIGEQLRVY